MDANRFYSVSFDCRNDMKVLALREACGGIAAYGRWQALLGMIYDQNGTIDAAPEPMWRVLQRELELDDAGLREFLAACADFGLIDGASWDSSSLIVSHGALEEIAYRRRKRAAGAKGGKQVRKQ